MSVNPYEAPQMGPQGYAPGPAPFQTPPAERLRAPAIVLLVLASITAALRVAATAFQLIVIGQGLEQIDGIQVTANIAGNGMALLLNIATAIGAYKMMRLESYSAAMTAAIISVIPLCSPCLIIGIPFGIWAIVVLNDPYVKAAFRP
jgi:O-antigen ligase